MANECPLRAINTPPKFPHSEATSFFASIDPYRDSTSHTVLKTYRRSPCGLLDFLLKKTTIIEAAPAASGSSRTTSSSPRGRSPRPPPHRPPPRPPSRARAPARLHARPSPSTSWASDAGAGWSAIGSNARWRQRAYAHCIAGRAGGGGNLKNDPHSRGGPDSRG